MESIFLKAYNKDELVQIPVQVQGRNGIFTRKQWKRVSELTPEEQKKYAPKAKEAPKPQKTKLSATDSKGKVGELTEVYGNEGLLAEMKKKGMSWKEHPEHRELNIMRAKMALKKHFDNGGEWGNLPATNVKKEEPKVKRQPVIAEPTQKNEIKRQPVLAPTPAKAEENTPNKEKRVFPYEPKNMLTPANLKSLFSINSNQGNTPPVTVNTKTYIGTAFWVVKKTALKGNLEKVETAGKSLKYLRSMDEDSKVEGIWAEPIKGASNLKPMRNVKESKNHMGTVLIADSKDADKDKTVFLVNSDIYNFAVNCGFNVRETANSRVLAIVDKSGKGVGIIAGINIISNPHLVNGYSTYADVLQAEK